MNNICSHDQGWYERIIRKPYYNEEQLVCCKCNEILKVGKVNNSISSYIGTQDPTKPINIGEDTYMISPAAKRILNKYEENFNLITQIVERLPEGQNNSSILGLIYNLQCSVYDRLSAEDCYLQIQDKKDFAYQYKNN